ncbi:hypothetical protein K432DRAFT_429545 [Lepidopterella palustris CBS 459.81]|uniref:Amidohydrolase-related domain-containing protein n=1 Tax=Lepidopterella palustris CBS 459.81 TaxID=1314670 RepID=A0A8E2JAF1_9PEZI|nr:hypothetical protein K432DRAFT_429545 [Lepidopterella palustris CBS 459.81]
MTSFIIRDVRVFTGETTIENGYVLVQDGKIADVGPTSSLPSTSFPTISKPNHTLLPGLIDAHIHADKGNPLALTQSLRFGITTVCDMHNEAANVSAMRDLTRSLSTAAGYKTAGISATIENGWPIPVITAHDKSAETAAEIATWPRLRTLEDVEAYLDMNSKEMEMDYVKLMHESGTAMGMSFPHPTEELQRMITSAAHARGYLTVAHALALEDTLTVLRAGVDGLTHTFYDQAPTEELVAAYKKNNSWLNPTLVAIGSLTTEGKALQERYAEDERVQALVGEKELSGLRRCMSMTKEGSKVQYAYDSVRVLKEAGVDIVCGSDSASAAWGTAWGVSIHHELYLLVKEAGMTPEEALRSATSITARRFNFTDRGRLVEGLNADLLLVEGNPLEDIDATLNLRGVWREGVLCSWYEGKV